MKSKNDDEQHRRSSGRAAGPGRITGAELGAPGRKLLYNQRLFAVVAPRYDLVTRLLSFGRDSSWKRRLVRLLPREATAVLDVACGTGDITFLLSRRYRNSDVTGLDLTEAMLVRARRRLTAGGRQSPFRRVRFTRGDMSDLKSFADERVDIVTGGYALRNAPDLARTVEEVHRVLRPGGTAAFLEFSLPDQPQLRRVQGALLRFWGQFWGVVLHGDPEVYGYIARSLGRFPPRTELDELFRSYGFRVLYSPSLMGGFARISRIRKIRRLSWQSDAPQDGSRGSAERS